MTAQLNANIFGKKASYREAGKILKLRRVICSFPKSVEFWLKND